MTRVLYAPTAVAAPRLRSLDVFRGATVAAMILVNNPGDWAHLYAPLAHAPWHGWTFTDWIFPFFLFICGVAMGWSSHRALNAGASRTALLLSLWRRAGITVFIGLALNFIPYFNPSTLRYPGVLQRIGLCVFLAAPLLLFWRTRGLALWAGFCLALYTLLLLAVPVPDANGVVNTGLLEPGRDTGAFVDRWLMSGHLWVNSKVWDPEGLLSTLPALSSLLAGVLCARGLLGAATPASKTVWMLLAGLLALWLGAMLEAAGLPINKGLWTPSYAVFMSGWALLVLGACYWLIDACDAPGVRAWSARLSLPFAIYGMNALFIFVFSGLVAKLLGYFKLKAYLLAPLNSLPLSPHGVSLLYALLFNLVMFAVAWVLWRRQIFIKL